ncbi:MAG: hypothetical protein WA584_08430 [Pyrinomonadaceae bacterium]
MKKSQIEVQEFIIDLKRLLKSAQNDYDQKHWNTCDYYISEINLLIERAENIGIEIDIPKVAAAERDYEVHHSRVGGTSYTRDMRASAASHQRKLREIINTADKLQSKIASTFGLNLTQENSPFVCIENICKKFHTVASQLRVRRENRPTIDVEDEYDVQDLLHALLRLHFEDIRPEEWTPSYAGGSARMDFLVKNEQIVIEAKKTRKGLAAKELGEQLIIDIEKYSKHPDCKTLVCFVYDPEGRIANPRGVEADLNSRSSEKIRIVTFIKPLAL